MLRSLRISPNSTTNCFSAASPNGSSSGNSAVQLTDELVVVAVVVAVRLEQDDAAGLLVPEQRKRVVDRLLEVAEADDVAVGLDRVEDSVGA